MAKELTNRADELKSLGWSVDEVSRYAELWDYRQRWGAINLEREDRQFLKKAESALPKIVSAKASVKKDIKEKSYYRRLSFYLQSMNQAEIDNGIGSEERGAWAILLEEELRALDYYQPVLGLPDTLRSKELRSLREDLISELETSNPDDLRLAKYDFFTPLDELKKNEKNNWQPLRDAEFAADKKYIVLSESASKYFRKLSGRRISQRIRQLFPSLSDSDKPEMPDEWEAKS